MYLWERDQWPGFFWNEARLRELLARAHLERGRLLGKMDALGFDLREEARLRVLTREIVKSSEIEGEILDGDQVRSSIARRLGLETGGSLDADRNVEGVVEMVLDATAGRNRPLTGERLRGWHAALFPTGHSGLRKITVGDWRDDRDGPMQVVSGPIGKERVHYEAPPADRVPDEMTRFLAWFERSADMDPLVKAGVCHLWFVTIHPFEDGNGRMARAVTDMALARADGDPRRFYSMSARIREERDRYYGALERAQRSSLDATPWLEWFLACLIRAVEDSENVVGLVLRKARFWERFAQEPLNARQIKCLNRMLDGFQGKMTSSKWAKIAKCSQDTAYRDILDLIRRDVLERNSGGGRSVSYSITKEIS